MKLREVTRAFLILLIGILLTVAGSVGMVLSSTLSGFVLSALALFVGILLIVGLVALIVYEAWIKI